MFVLLFMSSINLNCNIHLQADQQNQWFDESGIISQTSHLSSVSHLNCAEWFFFFSKKFCVIVTFEGGIRVFHSWLKPLNKETINSAWQNSHNCLNPSGHFYFTNLWILFWFVTENVIVRCEITFSHVAPCGSYFICIPSFK